MVENPYLTPFLYHPTFDRIIYQKTKLSRQPPLAIMCLALTNQPFVTVNLKLVIVSQLLVSLDIPNSVDQYPWLSVEDLDSSLAVGLK